MEKKLREIQKQVGIIGNSDNIREIIKIITSVAETDIPILVLGESGSGKEVVASAIHKLSKRSDQSMISVNCGAIPEGLIESELFGHEKGAFTGAVSSRKGYFELADNGTIFLDEVGELPLQTQVKLLRVLENGIFMRVGGTQYKKVNVRVIAATNRKLEQMVEDGVFRMDLFYRLKGIKIEIPPLRERKEDIELFVTEFLDKYAQNNLMDKIKVTHSAMELLKKYHWPGNVRELKNIVETLAVLSKNGIIDEELVKEHLPVTKFETEQPSATLPVVTNKTVEQAERELIYRAIISMGVEISEIKKFLYSSIQHLDHKIDALLGGNIGINENGEDEEIISLDELEKKAIRNALKKYRGNRKKISEKLAISERTLYRKIKEYGLENE